MKNQEYVEKIAKLTGLHVNEIEGIPVLQYIWEKEFNDEVYRQAAYAIAMDEESLLFVEDRLMVDFDFEGCIEALETANGEFHADKDWDALVAEIGKHGRWVDVVGDMVRGPKKECFVCTDEEADEYALSQIKDYVESEIERMERESPTFKSASYYFDKDSWEQDLLNNEGRGSSIASYDGEELEIRVEGKTYYVYRIN